MSVEETHTLCNMANLLAIYKEHMKKFCGSISEEQRVPVIVSDIAKKVTDI